MFKQWIGRFWQWIRSFFAAIARSARDILQQKSAGSLTAPEPPVTLEEHKRFTMHVRAHSFRLVKADNAPEEYEDACWPEDNIDQEADVLRFAVADGATDALFSGIWARILVEAYGTEQLSKLCDRKLLESFEQLQRKWLEQVEQRLVERRLAGPLSYFFEEKLRDGAFSTFVGLTIRQCSSQAEDTGEWAAVAVGDSCFFHVRDNQCILAFPLESAEQFNTSPHLLPSNTRFNHRIIGDVLSRDGQWRTGDEFYLMTDALACWFLGDMEREHTGWGEKLMAVRQIQTPDDFEQWIARLRLNQAIRNDDVTLLRIQME